jgi:hypothetical protein
MGAILPIIISFDGGSSGLISLISLHPFSAITYGLQVMGQLEDQGVGLQSSTVDNTDNSSGLTFNMCLQYLIRDSILWGILGWYLNRVIRPEYGQALPFYFPFTPSYWGCGGRTAPLSNAMTEPIDNADVPTEPIGEELRRQTASGESIEIRNLRKEFGEKVAVEDLSLSIFKGTSRAPPRPTT